MEAKGKPWALIEQIVQGQRGNGLASNILLRHISDKEIAFGTREDGVA
jgi:hypothetical protein